MKNQISFTKTLIALNLLLTPFVLAFVALSFLNSDFDGVVQMKLGRDGGEVILDRRTSGKVAD
ncbi:MAG: hypothetical protein F6K36_26320 [Symploca sp. SIO3C6]|uniref:Uncharacterized protein n=1 Tax=Symploca sp. SIO1C4 TaxID=2607765 RepID=A0A6B3NFG8_9CYAN|nr:hypothetical protein [Symploca sp. SIO3C6]NER30373.1 hypothetical protein [Symploca sp. SIO1C4]NET04760.1 hypothetical protein [Symploca sp. SIO2B6]